MNQQPQTATTATAIKANTIKTPLMSWSQTFDNVTLLIATPAGTAPDACAPDITITPTQLTVRLTLADTTYTVDAELFASVCVDKCTWRVLGNGDVLVTLCKRVPADDDDTDNVSEEEKEVSDDEEEKEDDEEEEKQDVDNNSTSSLSSPPTYYYAATWTHPFHDRAYKAFVRIDWTRWTDECNTSDDGDDSYDEEEDNPLGALSAANASDLGGDDGLLNENAPDFQEMMSNLSKLGLDKEKPLPMMDDVDGMDDKQLQTLLQSMSTNEMTGMDGVTGVDLEKVGATTTEEVHSVEES